MGTWRECGNQRITCGIGSLLPHRVPGIELRLAAWHLLLQSPFAGPSLQFLDQRIHWVSQPVSGVVCGLRLSFVCNAVFWEDDVFSVSSSILCQWPVAAVHDRVYLALILLADLDGSLPL